MSNDKQTHTTPPRWVFKDAPKDPFPGREFNQSPELNRSYGDWGGIYDENGTPLVGCNEYMVFKDRETAEFIVKAVNWYFFFQEITTLRLDPLPKTYDQLVDLLKQTEKMFTGPEAPGERITLLAKIREAIYAR